MVSAQDAGMIDRLVERTIYWEDVPAGYTREWRRVVSQDAVDAYCDGAEDYTPWYGPDDSPFGAPVVPPMLISRLCRFTMEPLGIMIGWVHVSQRNEVLQPVLVGAELRFHGKVTSTYERRGRAYVAEEVTVTDADGAPVLRHSRAYTAPRREPSRPEPHEGRND